MHALISWVTSNWARAIETCHTTNWLLPNHAVVGGLEVVVYFMPALIVAAISSVIAWKLSKFIDFAFRPVEDKPGRIMNKWVDTRDPKATKFMMDLEVCGQNKTLEVSKRRFNKLRSPGPVTVRCSAGRILCDDVDIKDLLPA